MKRFLLFSLVLSLGFACCHAQKKTTQAGKSSSTNNSISNYFNFYEVDAGTQPSMYALSSEGIFYAEDGDDNKVVFIDKNTGQRKIIVPGIANVYENARPKICKVKYCADKVLLNVYDAPDLVGNYYNIDEKGGWKFQNNFKCEEIQSINGDYILYHTAGGTLEENYNFTLMDMRTGKKIGTQEDGSFNWGFGMPFLNSQGKAFYFMYKNNELRAMTVDVPTKKETVQKFTDAYLKSGDMQEFGALKKLYLEKDGYIYCVTKRRVYRIKEDLSDNWQEFARMPANMPGEFADIAVNSKGDMMAVNTLSHIYLYFRSGHFDAPEDLKTLLKNNFVEITLWDVPITTDYDGNFLTFASPDFDTKFLVVFNPEGVKGTNGGGHIYRNTPK